MMLTVVCIIYTALLVCGFIYRGDKKKKYYITAPWICEVPVIAYEKSRLEALVGSGVSVWTEEEWNSCEPCQKRLKTN